MKNKFLLLGATALLSTGLAMNVMADGSQHCGNSSCAGYLTIGAGVQVLDPLDVSNQSSISFGTIIKPSIGETVILSKSAQKAGGTAILWDYDLDTLSKTDTESNDKPRLGRFSVYARNNDDSLLYITFPDEITLSNDEGDECGTASLEYEKVSSDETTFLPGEEDSWTAWDKSYAYWGTYTVTDPSALGTCQGTATVTVLQTF